MANGQKGVGSHPTPLMLFLGLVKSLLPGGGKLPTKFFANSSRRLSRFTPRSSGAMQQLAANLPVAALRPAAPAAARRSVAAASRAAHAAGCSCGCSAKGFAQLRSGFASLTLSASAQRPATRLSATGAGMPTLSAASRSRGVAGRAFGNRPAAGPLTAACLPARSARGGGGAGAHNKHPWVRAASLRWGTHVAGRHRGWRRAADCVGGPLLLFSFPGCA